MRTSCAQLQQRLGLTVVYVTHDQAEAMSMADQVVLLNKGRIEQARHAARLYAHRHHLRRALHRHAAMNLLRWSDASPAATVPPAGAPLARRAARVGTLGGRVRPPCAASIPGRRPDPALRRRQRNADRRTGGQHRLRRQRGAAGLGARSAHHFDRRAAQPDHATQEETTQNATQDFTR
jgi:sn-glycerol 3-phosphate transport system ATP-binding protein